MVLKTLKPILEGYETPKSYAKAGSDISVTPDIVAEKEGRKHYFDLSLKSEKPKLLKSKWLFLNTLSKLKSSRFRTYYSSWSLCLYTRNVRSYKS